MSDRTDHADACGAVGWLWSRGTTAVAVLLLAVSVPLTARGYGLPLVLTFLVCSAQALALPVALRHPGRATALNAAALLTLAWAGDGGGTAGLAVVTVPGTAVLAVVLQVLVVGMLRPPRTAVACAAVLAGAVLLVVATSVGGARGLRLGPAVDELLLYLVTLALALLAAVDLRRRGRTEADGARARHEAALEVDRRSLAHQRARIARELHDLVAHSMSSIHLQASSAPYRLSGLDPAAHSEFGEIAAGSRDVMRDLGQLLRVLQEDERDVAVAPLHGLGEIADEVASAQEAGTPVDLVMDLERAELERSPELRAAAVSVVQEGLRNVQRHAAGARTTVTLAVEPRDCLTVAVRNGAPPRRTTSTHSAPAPPDDPDRWHLGLLGLEERARSLGGRLAHGPTDEGGYHVTVVLPARGVLRQRAGLS